MSDTFNWNSCTGFVFCESPINASDQTDNTTFYDGLSSLAWQIFKRNVLIGGDRNARTGKDKNKKKIGL